VSLGQDWEHIPEEPWCQNLINALGDCRFHASLKSIHISEEIASSNTPIDIRPLFVFSDLTEITLDLSGPLEHDSTLDELGDTFLKDMARGWPRLTTLSLFHYRGLHVTLPRLVPLAQYCLELRSLNIRVDARSAPPSIAEYSTVKNETLRDLHVMDSPIVDPGRVATFIYGIFPRASLSFYKWGPTERWREVHDALQAYSQSVLPSSLSH
jgi:hypothetical protein